jgi:hypothetical protein
MRHRSSKSNSTEQSRPAADLRPATRRHHRGVAVAILATTTCLGLALRWLSFRYESSLLATSAAMILFAPASFATVALGWGTPLRSAFATKAVICFVSAFLTWNAVMLPGLSSQFALLALKMNLLHWGTFLLSGILSLRIVQWIAGLEIATDPDASTSASIQPGQVSLAKILALTAACAAATETARRVASTPETYASFLTGALGGSLLGMHWTVLSWIRGLRSWRTAGLIVWIALVAIIRWKTDTLVETLAAYAIHLPPPNLDDRYYVVDFGYPSPQIDFQKAMRFLWEAMLQTMIVFVGFESFRAIGYPLRSLRQTH